MDQNVGYYIIGAIGLLAWVAVIWIMFGRRRSTRGVDEVKASNAQVIQRLDEIDARVAAIEKTLHDIP